MSNQEQKEIEYQKWVKSLNMKDEPDEQSRRINDDFNRCLYSDLRELD